MSVYCYLILIVTLCGVQLGELITINYDNGGVYNFYQDSTGNYKFRFKLQDQKRQEEGVVTKTDTGQESIFVRGEYSYSYKGAHAKVVYEIGEDGIRSHSQLYTGPAQPNFGGSFSGENFPKNPLTGEPTQNKEIKVPFVGNGGDDDDGASRGYLPPLSKSFTPARDPVNVYDLRPPSANKNNFGRTDIDK